MKKLLALSITLALAPVAAFAQRGLALWAEFGRQETYPALRSVNDLRNFQYRIVRFASGGVNVASNDVSMALAERPAGVLQNNPNSGEAATVAYLGASKVKAGAAITQFDNLTTNGSGKAVAAGSGDVVVGVALEAAGAEDDVISAMLFPPMRTGSVA